MVDGVAAAGIPIASVHGTVGTGPATVPYGKLAFTINESADQLTHNEAGLAMQALPHGGKVAIILGAAGFAENSTGAGGVKSALAGPGGFPGRAAPPGRRGCRQGAARGHGGV